MNKKFLLRYICPSVAGTFVVLAISSCQSAQDEAGLINDESQETSSITISEVQTTASSAIDIKDILQQWSSGQEDEAIEKFLQLYDDKAPLGKYRMSKLTEQQTIARPMAELEKLKQEMTVEFGVLRTFNRAMQSKAKADIAIGDYVSAKRILLALKQLGQANTGPEVNLLLGQFGTMIEKNADLGLVKLREAQSGKTPPPKSQ